MPKYQRKPIEIEAFQYDGDFKTKDNEYYVPQWAVQALREEVLYFRSSSIAYGPGALFVETLEGRKNVPVGDYIIKGVNGEIYTCKSDIFEETHEVIE